MTTGFIADSSRIELETRRVSRGALTKLKLFLYTTVVSSAKHSPQMVKLAPEWLA